MDKLQHFRKVSKSPTNPHLRPESPAFDIAELYQGPLETAEVPSTEMSLDEKLRQAYFWIVNHAIISPFYDIEYHDGPAKTFQFGTAGHKLSLPSDQSYSSFVLLPLLNFAVRRKCLLIGGPGRGKTASAVLMGVLAGYPVKEVRRAIQHGQPQMTITDLLGNPLPSYLIGAKNMDEVKISWRKWLGMRIKIIDEYNRIPTRTQSALLTLMGDNYAEIFDQIYECPESAWYLTANTETEGGTYQVIEALRDRIDIVVKTLHFSAQFLGDLILRIENEIKPEEIVPPDIIFSEAEMDAIYQAILRIKIPLTVQQRLEFFSSHFEYCESAGVQFEYKTKDTLKLSSLQGYAWLNNHQEDQDLGSQTINGISVRALQTLILFCKAMAYFRGHSVVEMEDVRQILPFVLHDKLSQNPEAPYFEKAENQVFRVDKISWLRRLFDQSCLDYARLQLDQNNPLAELSAEFELGLEWVSAPQVRERLFRIENLIQDYANQQEMNGPIFEDIIKLKYLHQRYTNYLKWLEWKS